MKSKNKILIFGLLGTVFILLVGCSGNKNKKNTTATTHLRYERVFLAEPSAIAEDLVNNRIFVSDNTSHSIIAIDLTTQTGVKLNSEPLYNVRSMAYDPVSDNLFVAGDGQSIEGIRKIHVASQAESWLNVNNRYNYIKYNPTTNKLFAANTGIKTIFTIDAITGTSEVLSNNTINSAVDFVSIASIVYNPSTNRLFVNDTGAEAIIEVDVSAGFARGTRSLVSDYAHTGPGIDTSNYRALSLSADTDRILVFRYRFYFDEPNSIIEIDVNTGSRNVVEDFAASGSLRPGYLTDMVYSPHINGLVLIDDDANGVFSQNVTTHQQNILYQEKEGDGLPMVQPNALAYDRANNRVYIPDSSRHFIFAVDLATGNREVEVARDDDASQIDVAGTKDIVYDKKNNRLFCLGPSSDDHIVQVNLTTNVRSLVSDNTSEQEPVFDSPSNLTYDGVDNKLYVYASGNKTIYAVDVSSGARTILSNTSIDSNPGIGTPSKLIFDQHNRRLLYVDSSLDAIVAVNIEDGDRTILSDDNLGTGEEMVLPRAIALGAANQAYVFDNAFGVNQVFKVNLSTGDREIIYTHAGDNSPSIVTLADMTYDAQAKRLLMVDQAMEVLMQIDLESGVAAVISK